MDLNLRKARKLESKIGKYINDAELKTDVNLRAKSSILDATSKRQEGAVQLTKDLADLDALNNVRYSLRNQIAAANQGVGINALMTKREQLKSKAGILTKLASASKAVSTEELQDILETTAKSLEKGESRGYGRTEVTVNTSVILETTREAINTEITSTVKALEDVEDELAQKNLGAKVTLSAQDVALLTAKNLI